MRRSHTFQLLGQGLVLWLLGDGECQAFDSLWEPLQVLQNRCLAIQSLASSTTVTSRVMPRGSRWSNHVLDNVVEPAQ